MKEEYMATVVVLEKREVFASTKASSLEEAKQRFQEGKFKDLGGQMSGDFQSVMSVEDLKTPKQLQKEMDESQARMNQLFAWSNEVDDHIKASLGQDSRVDYSIFKPPQSVAIEGKCILHHQGWGEDHVTSQVMENPSWLDVAVFAHEAIALSGDGHHIFLEGVIKRGEPEAGVQRYELCMGS